MRTEASKAVRKAWQAATYAERKALGICVGCGVEDAVPKRVRCRGCLEDAAAHARTVYALRVQGPQPTTSTDEERNEVTSIED